MAMKRKRDLLVCKTSKGVRKTKGEVDDPEIHPLGTTLADLPYEIVKNILLKLPIKSVLICNCVCKSWHTIMSDPFFAQAYFECVPVITLVRTSDSRRVSRNFHLLDFDEDFDEAQNSPSYNCYGRVPSCKDSPGPNCNNHMKLDFKFKLPLCDSKMVLDTMLEAKRKGKKRTNIACKPKDDKFDIVNSCNGLLCLWGHVKRNTRVLCNQKTLVVCNPITGEFIRLPQSEKEILMGCSSVYHGFGYLKKTNEYKVIRIYACPPIFVEVHTLGTKLWRNIKYHGPFWLINKSPTYLNGSLHWLVYDSTGASILCFDLESETSNSFPLPYEILSTTTRCNTRSHISFGELKGRLYLCCPYSNPKIFGFWTMEKYGDGQSWIRVCSFDIEDIYRGPHLYRPTVVFGGDGILIHDHSRFFMYYDARKHLFKFLESRGTSFKLEPLFHIPSLIRLKDVVKGDDVEVLNVHSRCATFKLLEDKEALNMVKYKADMSCWRIKKLCIGLTRWLI